MTAGGGGTIRPLSDRLLEAAARIDELPHADTARLLMKAAIRLRAVQHTGAKLEHVPVYAYHLLRRITRGPLDATTLHGHEDAAAVTFLLSRDLIVRSADDQILTATAAGEEIGEIADEREV